MKYLSAPRRCSLPPPLPRLVSPASCPNKCYVAAAYVMKHGKCLAHPLSHPVSCHHHFPRNLPACSFLPQTAAALLRGKTILRWRGDASVRCVLQISWCRTERDSGEDKERRRTIAIADQRSPLAECMGSQEEEAPLKFKPHSHDQISGCQKKSSKKYFFSLQSHTCKKRGKNAIQRGVNSFADLHFAAPVV